jgi:hypothetical protein
VTGRGRIIWVGGPPGSEPDWVPGMTLADAVALLDAPAYACACLGGPNCCVRRFAQARELIRVAHVAVKMMDDLSRRTS